VYLGFLLALVPSACFHPLPLTSFSPCEALTNCTDALYHHSIAHPPEDSHSSPVTYWPAYRPLSTHLSHAVDALARALRTELVHRKLSLAASTLLFDRGNVISFWLATGLVPLLENLHHAWGKEVSVAHQG
jgi:hypothetical protein